MGDYNVVKGNGSGSVIQGGHGNTYTTGPAGAANTGNDPRRRTAAGAPVHALYGFVDIVEWSGLNARLQTLSTSDLVDFLELGLIEAGIDPDQVDVQNQGDACFLTFPAHADPGEVLAKLPRRIDDQLAARNRDMAVHARMRVRMAFSMGASAPGAAGRVGQAPVAVARLVNSDVLRSAMRAAPDVRCGVIVDRYVFEQCVEQRFRVDLEPGDWAPVRIIAPSKNFEAAAWMRLFGRTGEQLRGLLA